MRRRIVIGFAVAVGLLAVVVGVVPGVVARKAAPRVSAAIGSELRIGWLWWNPLLGRWTARDVRLAADRGPAAFSARRVSARLRLRDVLRGVYRVESAEIERARVRLRATPDGWRLPLPDTGGGGAPPSVSLDAVSAPRSRVRLEPVRGRPSRLDLRHLHVGVSIDSAQTRVSVWSWGRLDRAPVSVVGRIQTVADAARVRLRLSASRLDLARALALTGPTPSRRLAGQAELHVKYEETGARGAVERAISGRFAARGLAIGDEHADGLLARHVAVSRFTADLARRRLAVGDVRVRDPELWLRRDGGRVTVPGILDPDAPSTEAPPWSTTLASVEIAGGTVHHVDATTGETLDVAVEEARLGRLDAPDAPAPLAVTGTLEGGGRVVLHGEVVREPLAARGHAEVTHVALPPLAGVFGAPLRLESGETSGELDVAFTEGRVEGSGRLTVADVKTISPDDSRPEHVMAFKEARIAVRRMSSAPPAVLVDSLEVDWPYVLVDRTAAGIFPISLASRASDTEAAGAAPRVQVGRLHVLGGRIDFRDATLEPPYWRALANLDLDARRMDTSALRIGTLRATGMVDEISPLRVEGTVGDRTRLVAEIERLDLLPFNAYLQGASPYTVASGAVSGRSEITLDQSELDVNSHVVLSRFGLAGGDDEDVVKRDVGIPLTLAVALMKDYRGDIALELPFSGNLKQPEFQMRSVIVQAIVRAVRGAVLSPLNALGRVFMRDGRIERVEIEAVPFPPAGRLLDDAGRERLAQVARVLASHRDLAVRFRGVASADDVARMQDEAALAALGPGRDAEPLRAFVRARLAGRPLPALDAGQKTRLDDLLASLPWPEDQLHELARDRGSVAVASLVLDHQIDPERVAAEAPVAPAREQLAPVGGASVELHEH